jgi:hypothetical protein
VQAEVLENVIIQLTNKVNEPSTFKDYGFDCGKHHGFKCSEKLLYDMAVSLRKGE